MKTITVAVCEDNSSSLAYIQQAIQGLLPSFGFNGIISTFTSSTRFLNLIQEGSCFELYFLDIDMPEVDGLKVAANIRELDKNAVIMFVSAKEEYVFASFRVQPFRFIRKSHFKSDLPEALNEYFQQKKLPGTTDVLTISLQNTTYRFNVGEIQYIQAKDNYLDIITTHKSTLIRYKISDIEKLLENYQFLRIHKSYLVNFQYIYIVRNKQVILEDGTTLPVSRHRAEEVQSKFKEFIQCS